MATVVAVYYRVSTDRQDLASQKLAVEKYLAEHGITDALVYADHGISGATTARPSYQRLKVDGKAGRFQQLVTYRIDRIGRNSTEALEFILMLSKWGVDFVSVTQPHLSTANNPFRNTMIAMMTDIAQIERDIIRERVNHGLAAAKARGVKLGAPPKLTPADIELAEALRAAGRTYREIAEKLRVQHTTVFAALKQRELERKEVPVEGTAK